MLEQVPDLVGLDLDTGDVAVMADAHLPFSKGLARGFGRLALAQCLDSHLGAVGDARRKASKGCFVPVGQPKAAGGGANVGLPHPSLEQRETDATAHRRSVARAVVAGVIGGGAVCDVQQPEVATDGLQRLEELFFAVEASIGIVAPVLLELDLAG